MEGRSQGGPAARGVPSGAPGLDLGPPQAPFGYYSGRFFDAFSDISLEEVLHHFLMPFGSFWGPFRHHFGSIFVSIFEC